MIGWSLASDGRVRWVVQAWVVQASKRSNLAQRVFDIARSGDAGRVVAKHTTHKHAEIEKIMVKHSIETS